MDTALLASFLEVARHLHFGRAADSLDLTQPALSHQIRRLERQLDVPLFERTSRQVHLTPAGHALVPQARRILTDLERAVFHVRAVAAGGAGQLKLGSIGAALGSITPHLVQGIRECLPGLAVQVTQMDSPVQLAALHAGELDFGIVRSAGPVTGVDVEDLFCEPMILAVPQDHGLAERELLSAADLREEQFVLWPRVASPLFHDQVLTYCRQAGFQPQVAMEGTDIETQLGLVSAGVGVSPQPASFANLRRRGVAFRSLDGAPRTTVQLAWRAAPPPARLATAIEIARRASLRVLADRGSEP
jgi:DNA-binding transcriptional LysR family regulator